MDLSPVADSRMLCRRLYVDLHGLPPTPDEVDAFARDSDPHAWEKLVDRLLASPRYGERWARHWLDTIHFADSHGFEHDVLRTNAWRYRDYVIESFNRDTPWPRFIREQLAADVFFPDEPRLMAGLGFLGAGPYDQSAAGTAQQSFEYLDRDDLVTQTMGAFVSTTANCARCHAHKFDPITQEDYFALQAVFAGVGKGDISYDEDIPTAQQRRRWQSLLTAASGPNRSALLTPENESLALECEQTRGAAAWQVLSADTFTSSSGSVLQRLPDGSVLAGGPRPDTDTFTITTAPATRGITALRLDVLCDDSLPMHGPGRMDNGNLHLTEFEAQLFRKGASKPEKLKIRRATADFDQDGWTIAHAIDGDVKTAWGIHPGVGEPHHAVFELESPLNTEPGAKLAIVLQQLHGRGHLIGRLRLSVSNAPSAAAVAALPAAAEAVLTVPLERRTVEQRTELVPALLRLRARKELQRLPAPAKVFAAGAVAGNERGMVSFAEPRVVRLLKRGDLDKPGDEIPAGALSAVTALKARFDISNPKSESARRAALADWLADERNPLTWRSIANRVWQHHFGRGLCDSPGDFGHMGGAPSHPELLDWLAAELRDHGGSLKHLHRLILTSATYRQSSSQCSVPGDQSPALAAPAENRELSTNPWQKARAVDPDNRLLWRTNRRRLDADSYRDAVLAVSGRLDLTMGGPGVALFKQSPGPQLTPALDYAAFDWSAPEAARRSIYRIVWRGIADPFMDALDFPDMSLLSPTRGFSASPLQALALLNNSFVLHHSNLLAARAEKAGGSLADQIRAAVRLCWLRDPAPAEAADFLALAEKHGLPAVCRLLLNSNEFLFVD